MSSPGVGPSLFRSACGVLVVALLAPGAAAGAASRRSAQAAGASAQVTASGASGQIVYTARGGYTAQAGPGAPITATVTCPESEPTTTKWWLYQTLLATNPSGGEQTPGPSGVLAGSSNLPEPGGLAEWSWTLSPRG
jgi:hypothetical protein